MRTNRTAAEPAIFQRKNVAFSEAGPGDMTGLAAMPDDPAGLRAESESACGGA